MIRRVIERDMFTSLLATFGLAIVMAQLMNLIFGSQVVTADSGLGIRSLFGGMVTIAEIKVVSLVLCALMASVIVLFMKRSRMGQAIRATAQNRSEEHTSELQSLMRISYAVFCLKKKKNKNEIQQNVHIMQDNKTPR